MIIRHSRKFSAAGFLQFLLSSVVTGLASLNQIAGNLKDRDHPGMARHELKPWRQECWCIPPKQNASFVAAMEDVLAVYARPPQKDILLVCLDEFAKQLLSETRQPVAAIPGHLARADCE